MKNFIIKIINNLKFTDIFDFLSLKFFEKQENIIILLYHRVAPKVEKAGLPAISPKEFEKQIKYLKNKYHVISFYEFIEFLKNNKPLPPKKGKRFVVITFDDGWKDNYQYAYPILKKYSLPAIFYITYNFIEEDSSLRNNIYMSWKEIRDMKENGLFEFGAHTMNHPKLTTIEIEEARKEILFSKNKIEDRLGCEIKTFAYPFGTESDFNEDIINAVKDAGFSSAVTAVPGFNNHLTDVYKIKRIVSPFLFDNFKMKITKFSIFYSKYGSKKIFKKI